MTDTLEVVGNFMWSIKNSHSIFFFNFGFLVHMWLAPSHFQQIKTSNASVSIVPLCFPYIPYSVLHMPRSLYTNILFNNVVHMWFTDGHIPFVYLCMAHCLCKYQKHAQIGHIFIYSKAPQNTTIVTHNVKPLKFWILWAARHLSVAFFVM